MRAAGEGQHVVLAEAAHVEVAHKHEPAVALILKERGAHQRRWVARVALGALEQRLGHALGRALQPLA